MADIKLRDYQEKAIGEIRQALAKYKRVIFQLGTGGGKTVCFSFIALASGRLNRKVLILSDRSEILYQNGGTLQRMGLEVGYISPRQRNVPTERVCVGMCQTLKRRVEKQEWLDYLQTIELLIIDEAHSQISDFVHELVSDKCFVLGVTATPQRYGGMRQLGSMYKAMVTGVTVKEMISKGYLSPAEHYSIVAPKMEDVPYDYATGDYNQRALAAKFETKPQYIGTVKEFLRIAKDKKTICFCVSSKQAIELTKEFEMAGVSAKYVLSGSFEEDSTYSGKRSDVFDEFHRGEFQVLVNVGITTAGFDEPSVECVILNFATASLTKYLQAVGRGSRVCPGKKSFTILDCGGNFHKFGLYDADREWCLWHTTGNGGGVMAVKLCDPKEKNAEGVYGCGAMVPQWARVCPCCGRKFITEKDEFVLHLEKVTEQTENDSIAHFAAQKKQEGWSLSRIMVQVCLRNPDNAKAVFTEAYLALYPKKTGEDAGKYWWVWKNNVWDNIKRKQDLSNDKKLF